MAHLQATLITRNTNSEPQLSKTGIHSFHQETRITKYCRVTNLFLRNQSSLFPCVFFFIIIIISWRFLVFFLDF